MSEQDYMTCRELVDFIMDYLDGTLPTESNREFERHLAVCPPCRAYLDSYKKTIELGKAALIPSDQPASGMVPEKLVGAVRAAIQRRCTES